MKVCSLCESDAVYFDAYVGVKDETDVRTFNAVFCDDCGGETSLKDKNIPDCLECGVALTDEQNADEDTLCPRCVAQY